MANEALDMALASGVPMLEVTGRHAVAYTHYYRGEWSEAIPHTEAALALYSLEQERALTSTFQLSSTVNLVAARRQQSLDDGPPGSASSRNLTV